MATEQKPKKDRRRLYVIIAIIIIIALLLALALWPSSSSGSGDVKFSGIDVQWNGQTNTLLDSPYSSSTSDHGYGSSGFTFNAEFIDSGTCSGVLTVCFNPSTSFNITSATPGFVVSWVTACYQSRGYSALVGPIYFKYSPSPGAPLSGCSSSTSGQVDLAGITVGTFVYLTVSVQFKTSSYSGTLSLKATNTQNVKVETGDPTTMAVECNPGAIVVGGLTQCTARVSDTSLVATAPTGSVNFTANSGQFGPASYCTLIPSTTNATSSCSVNYEASTYGSQLILANYNGDSTHVSSSGGFGVNAFQYSMTVTPTSQSVKAGGSVALTVDVTLQGGSGQLANVTLSVESCFSGVMTCTFSPAQVVPTSGGATSTLTIAVAQQPAVQLPATFSLMVMGTTGSGDYASTVSSTNIVTITITQ